MPVYTTANSFIERARLHCAWFMRVPYKSAKSKQIIDLIYKSCWRDSRCKENEIKDGYGGASMMAKMRQNSDKNLNADFLEKTRALSNFSQKTDTDLSSCTDWKELDLSQTYGWYSYKRKERMSAQCSNEAWWTVFEKLKSQF